MVETSSFARGHSEYGMRLRRERLRQWLEALALEIIERAVECGENADARTLLDLRLELQAHGLPVAFGNGRHKARRKQRFKVGDFCECFHEADGLWYLARVIEARDKFQVEYYGYGIRAEVPSTWLRKTKRAPRIDAPNPHPCDDKYWAQRYLLFSRFDDVVLPDAESWFSVTPEAIAAHIAKRVRPGFVVVDACCGCGGNAIQFALAGATVIAVDLDPAKLAAAQHNARVYECASRIDFIQADAQRFLTTLSFADIVFLSPPWGGPNYLDRPFDPAADIRLSDDCDGLQLAELALKLAPNLIFFLPRTLEKLAATRFLTALFATAGILPCRYAELESNYLNQKLKAKTLYLGPLFAATPPPIQSPAGVESPSGVLGLNSLAV